MESLKKITSELDKVASAIESASELDKKERLFVAHMIDEVSDHLEELDKVATVLQRDEDEKFMERYNQVGSPMHDKDEKYMDTYVNAKEDQAVVDAHKEKYEKGDKYVRDRNTDLNMPEGETLAKIKKVLDKVRVQPTKD